MRYRERPCVVNAAEVAADCASVRARVWRGMIRLLSKAKLPIPTPDEIESELKRSWRDGYIKALRDVQREREQMEAQRYLDAMPSLTKQEARTFSHEYEK